MADHQSEIVDANHKQCPKCRAIVPAVAKVCMACGASIPRVQTANLDEAPAPSTFASPSKQEHVAYSWPLGGGAKVEVVFTAEPTRAQLDVMIAQLKIMREVAAE
jgi:hypothetical protein